MLSERESAAGGATQKSQEKNAGHARKSIVCVRVLSCKYLNQALGGEDLFEGVCLVKDFLFSRWLPYDGAA